MLKVEIVNSSNMSLPEYKTEYSAGMDLMANIETNVVLKPLERKLISTGLKIALPKGYEGQIRPRSGLALKHGISIVNSPGTIDADYRGELKILLINLSNENFEIKKGDRIAQLVVAKHETVVWEIKQSLETTQRGEGGYGHTGTN